MIGCSDSKTMFTKLKLVKTVMEMKVMKVLKAGKKVTEKAIAKDVGRTKNTDLMSWRSIKANILRFSFIGLVVQTLLATGLVFRHKNLVF